MEGNIGRVMTCLITTYANYTVATNIESKIIKMSKREKTLFRYFVNGKEEEQHISQW